VQAGYVRCVREAISTAKVGVPHTALLVPSSLLGATAAAAPALCTTLATACVWAGAGGASAQAEGS